ncbi:MAG: hypothetical protein ACREJD_16870 [Phycisphaerales bacterium]
MLLAWLMNFAYSLAAGIAFWFGEPAPSRRYIADFNAEVLALPETATAWRIVRQAALRPVPLIEGAKYPDMGIQATVPEDPLWSAMAKAVEKEAEGIELALRAAERSRMGMPLIVFGETATSEENWAMLDRVDPRANPSPIEVNLPYLGQIRKWARELAADCRIAAEAGDAKRVIRDLNTMLKLSGLLREPPMLINQLVDYAVSSVVTREVGIVLASYPGLLDDGQLGVLAEELKRTQKRLRAIDLEWDWAFLLDWIGRVYSDDGRGNGVVTYSGLNEQAKREEISTKQRVLGLVLSAILGADVSRLSGSKRDLLERVDAARHAIQRDIETKPWLRQEWQIDSVVRRDGADMKQLGDFPLAIAIPGIQKGVESWNGVLNQIDLIILIIELERFRIRNGDYPQSLAELLKNGLGEIPRDLMDGQPIRYLYRERDLPLVYSIGADGVDDGGHAAADNPEAGQLNGKRKLATGSEWNRERLKGDSVYWPPMTVQWIDEGEKPFVPRRPLTRH